MFNQRSRMQSTQAVHPRTGSRQAPGDQVPVIKPLVMKKTSNPHVLWRYRSTLSLYSQRSSMMQLPQRGLRATQV